MTTRKEGKGMLVVPSPRILTTMRYFYLRPAIDRVPPETIIVDPSGRWCGHHEPLPSDQVGCDGKATQEDPSGESEVIRRDETLSQVVEYIYPREGSSSKSWNNDDVFDL